ncbi:hypothetical protein GCM10010124_25880 [Pilimelia terevasa]|uniref:Uncharacterized protein n=1 Tax=Pilimelia terevasa TaxID=53372 RepID=A0A8J3BRN3_9ACTN|nr:hypothetical protein [Pilimelia terevasa]GGK31932.1 hypothetical protein GCM10010124_25880 [Pilimelia terevasa]
MTWFKVDDGLHKHRKRIRVGMSLEGMAAMGLWAVAGSWASDELTDGWVPDDVLEYLAPIHGGDLAKRLESAGLWERTVRGGEEGWQFHEWSSHQPSKDRVLADRAAAADRQQRARDRARAARESRNRHGVSHERGAEAVDHDDVRVPSEEAPESTATAAPSIDGDASLPSPTDIDAQIGPGHGGSHGVRHGVTDPSVTVPPTRPDPTRTSYGSNKSVSAASGAARKRATRLPEGFAVTDEMKTWFVANCPGIDGRREHERFTDYWTGIGGAKGTKTDWVATWRNWMRKAADDQRARPAARGPMTGANRFHNDQTDEERARRNPYAGGKNAIIASRTGASA